MNSSGLQHMCVLISDYDNTLFNKTFNIYFSANTTYYLKIVCIPPAMMLQDHRIVRNVRCGRPQLGEG